MKILFLVGRHEPDPQLPPLDPGAGGRTVTPCSWRDGCARAASSCRAGVEHERVTGRVNPTERSDAWRDFVDLLRGARDYVRYFDPRYAQATRLVRRAYEIAPTEFVLYLRAASLGEAALDARVDGAGAGART